MSTSRSNILPDFTASGFTSCPSNSSLQGISISVIHHLVLYAASQVKERKSPTVNLSPSEQSDGEMSERAQTTAQVSRIKRDAAARERCISMLGATCTVCGFDFERTYGKIGAGFIHVYHLNPLATSDGKRKVNPETDLRPVCPNCNEMLHRQRPSFTIQELQDKIER